MVVNSVSAELVDALVDLGRVQEGAPLNRDFIKANPDDGRGILSKGWLWLSPGDAEKAAVEHEFSEMMGRDS